MPAPPISNTLEGGTQGTAITTANSGGASGTAFSTLTGAPTFDNTHAKGSFAMKIVTAATPVAIRTDWTALGGGTADIWFRYYIYMTASPGAQLSPSNIRTTTGTLTCEMEISTTRLLQMENAANAIQAALTSATVIAINQWVRIEFRVRASATVGQLEWWLYNTDPEAAIGSPTETKSATGLALGATSDQVRWGVVTTPAPASYTVWYDDFGVSTTGQVGPSGAAAAARRRNPVVVNQAVQRAVTRCQKLTRRESGLFVPAEWTEKILVPA